MLVEIVLFLLILCFWLYYYVTKQFNYFKDKGVPYSKPSFPFGSPNAKKLMMEEITIDNEVWELLKESDLQNEKVFGYFSFGQPNWVVRDEEIAKHILIKDFDHFTDIRTVLTDDNSRVSKIFKHMLFNLKGEEWKKMRSIVSGVFTGHKLKSMTFYMSKCGLYMEEFVEDAVVDHQELDIKSLVARFALDAIATSGFGIDSNSFKEPNSVFRKQALILMRDPEYASKWDMLRIVFIVVAPKLAEIFGLQFVPNSCTLFFANIIEKTYRHRLATGERREDIIDLLMDEMEAFEKMSDNNEKLDKETLLVANAMLFYIAGFDTTSITVSIIMHALMRHPEVREKLVGEIEDVLGDVVEPTYDHVQSMKYMDMVIQESLRNTTFLSQLERLCTKDYKIPGTDFVIEKGRYVKCYGRDMFTDEKNFKNAKEFDPENFSKENNHNKFAYQFFGQGPRGCVGMRYGLLVTKLSLVFLLRKFNWVKCDRTSEKLELNSAFSGFKNGCWLKPERRVFQN